MSSNTPDDRERPITRREFRNFGLCMSMAFLSIVLALVCLMAMEFMS